MHIWRGRGEQAKSLQCLQQCVENPAPELGLSVGLNWPLGPSSHLWGRIRHKNLELIVMLATTKVTRWCQMARRKSRERKARGQPRLKEHLLLPLCLSDVFTYISASCCYGCGFPLDRKQKPHQNHDANLSAHNQSRVVPIAGNTVQYRALVQFFLSLVHFSFGPLWAPFGPTIMIEMVHFVELCHSREKLGW